MGEWRLRAACLGQWELFDAAAERPGDGNPAAARAKALCRRCPVAAECLREAMASGEDGIWGATSPKFRTRHGSLPSSERRKKRSAA